MRNTFKIRFYCRPAKARKDGKSPVECSVIVSGDRQMITLPRSCKPDEFPTDDLKIYCHAVENKLNEIYTALTVADETVSAFILKDIYLNGAKKVSYTLNDMFSDGLSVKLSQDPGMTAYRKYELVKEHFLEKTGINPNREAGSVTHTDILKFKSALDAVHKPQTVQKEMMRLKYFFLLAFNSGKIRSNPFASITIRRARTENVFLTADELRAVHDAVITNDTYDRVRDTFIFMAGSGLEYADVAALQEGDVQTDGKYHYIKKKRVKTGIEYFSVLTPDAVEIWNFYGGKIPLLSNQKMNFYLKEIGKTAIISKKITTLTARHTYATQRLNEGLSLDIVSKMLGHNSTNQTRVYAKLLDESVIKAVSGLSAGLMEQKGVITPPKPLTPAYGAENGSDLEAFEAFLSKL